MGLRTNEDQYGAGDFSGSSSGTGAMQRFVGSLPIYHYIIQVQQVRWEGALRMERGTVAEPPMGITATFKL